MAVLPAEIPTGLVTGHYYFVNEDNIDVDTDPELTVVTGTVRFTASVKTLRMPSKKAVLVPLTFDGVFDSQGNLTPLNGTGVGMELPATNSPLFTEQDYTWRVEFNLKEAGTTNTVNLDSFDIQVPVGSTQDLSELIPVASTTAVLTLRGPKGDDGPAGVVSDASVAAALEQPLTKAALSGTIGDQVEAAVPGVVASQVLPVLATQVPPLVADAIAADGTVAMAAAAAVDDAMEGLEVAASVETFDADSGFAVLDEDGKKTSIQLGPDGKPNDVFAKDMGEAGGFPAAAQTYNEGFAGVDVEGTLIPDFQYDGSGYLAEEVVDRLQPRLQQRTPFNIPRMIRRLPAATESKLIQAHLNSVKYMLATWIPARFPGTDPITTLGGNTEARVRHPGAAAAAVAASIYTGTYDPARTGVSLAAAKASVLRIVKGGALCHITNTPDGWGAPAGSTGFYWQDSAWAKMYASAAWMLWADTDAQTKTYVGNMMAAEADNARTANNLTYWTKYDGTEVTPGDSKAEEMGWMGSAVATASLVLPGDPRKAAWDAKAQNYLLYASARPSDITLGSVVQGTKMASFDGWNVRQDGIVINHDLIHPDYMCFGSDGPWGVGVLWAYAGRKIPASFVHNGEWVYRALSDVRIKGRTIYQPRSWEVFYPNGNDWGTHRMADKAATDVAAHVLGLDSLCTTPAATWADLHIQRCLDLQARSTDGRTYLTVEEDTYAGAEPWVARNLGLAVLAAKIPMTARYNYEPIGA